MRGKRKSSGDDDERDSPDGHRPGAEDEDDREAREIRERVLRYLEETGGRSDVDE